jgi:hypothetical protein
MDDLPTFSPTLQCQANAAALLAGLMAAESKTAWIASSDQKLIRRCLTNASSVDGMDLALNSINVLNSFVGGDPRGGNILMEVGIEPVLDLVRTKVDVRLQEGALDLLCETACHQSTRSALVSSGVLTVLAGWCVSGIKYL